MVAYRCRYEPYNEEAIRIARSRRTGADTDDSRRYRFRHRRSQSVAALNKKLAGGGSMMDIGIYALNASRYLSGEEPIEVNGMIYTTPNDPRFKEVEENLQFPAAISKRNSGELQFELRIFPSEPLPRDGYRSASGDGSRNLVQRVTDVDRARQ